MLTPAQRKDLTIIMDTASACLACGHIGTTAAHTLRDAGEQLVELDISRRFPSGALDKKEIMA